MLQNCMHFYLCISSFVARVLRSTGMLRVFLSEMRDPCSARLMVAIETCGLSGQAARTVSLSCCRVIVGSDSYKHNVKVQHLVIYLPRKVATSRSDIAFTSTNPFGHHRPGCCASNNKLLGYSDVISPLAVGGDDPLAVLVAHSMIPTRHLDAY